MENLSEYKLLEGEFGKEIKLGDFTDKNIINSYGGSLSDGLAAYDFLKSNPSSEVVAMGMCASSGTIALVGATNRVGTKNSKFFIHNPQGEAKGDAEKIMQVAKNLSEEQERLINIYEKELTIDRAEIIAQMNNPKPFGVDRALEIGLINEVIDDNFTPTTENTSKEIFFNYLNQKKMSENSVTKQDLKEMQADFNQKHESILSKIQNFFGTKIKNILLKDANGAELDFSVDTEEEIAVGVTATVDGSPAEGEYVMPSGETFVFSGGELTERISAAPDEMEALKQENEELKAKLAESETAQAASEEKIQNLTKEHEVLANEVNEFKNVFSEKISNFASPEVKQEKKKESSKAFKNTKTLKI